VTIVARDPPVRASLLAAAGVLLAGATALGQSAPVRIEYRAATPGAIVEAAAGSSVTLVFRIVNPGATAQRLMTHVEPPPGWQVLFASSTLDLPPQGSVIETVTIASPRNAGAGDYAVRYDARMTPSDTPVSNAVIVRIGQRRQIALAWRGAPSYRPSGEPGTFELLVTNSGNVTERVTINVTSGLGVSLRPSWAGGAIDAGETRHIQVARQRDEVRLGVRETLRATASAEGLPAIAEANLGFDVVPEGRAPDPRRSQLPATLAIRAGTGRKPGFGSFVGSGALNRRRTAVLNFGFVARDRSHPLMFERDRSYASITAPGVSLAAGHQTWSLSYLTEGGHYGLGAGGRLERRHWSAGAFVDTGRHDVTEGSQAGGYFGLTTGHLLSVSAQYLARFADGLRSNRIANIGSVRVVLKPTASFTADFEAGLGQSTAGTGRAVSGLIAFNSRVISLYGRRVRKDDGYPLRDRTGLIDGAGLSLRPFGRFQVEGTLDGTGQIDDPTLPIDAPTRQRMTRASVAWGSLARVTAGRTEWTSPGRGWSAQWRRESVRAEMRIPFGALWLSPGIERGTQATPSYAETPYSLSWLRAGVRIRGRNTADIRVEYGRGDSGNASRTVRRVSFGAALQPVDVTRLTIRVSNGARDALWLQGTESITAMLDQRLPWRHHVVVKYQRRSGGSAFVRDDKAYRVDYVIPIGIPVRPDSDSGRITVRLRDGDTGLARAHMRVHVGHESRLTDRDGVVAFTGLKPGDYHVTVSPDSLGPGRTVVPALPLAVSVKGGGRVEVSAVVVRTGTITGAIQVFIPMGSAPPAPGISNALIELLINDEHRTAVTDAKGRFSFDDVPPGHWRLRVVRAAIPAFYLLEQAQVIVTVTPAGTRHVVLRVVPKSQ
jgi:hypothetical protein